MKHVITKEAFPESRHQLQNLLSIHIKLTICSMELNNDKNILTTNDIRKQWHQINRNDTNDRIIPCVIIVQYLRERAAVPGILPLIAVLILCLLDTCLCKSAVKSKARIFFGRKCKKTTNHKMILLKCLNHVYR